MVAMVQRLTQNEALLPPAPKLVGNKQKYVPASYMERRKLLT
jgi:hypothetical protein